MSGAKIINPGWLSLLLFLLSCGHDPKKVTTEDISLYPEPLTVALDTTNGYTINKLTGDSIKPLLDAAGVTVKTGILVYLNSSLDVDPGLLKPTIVTHVTSSQKNIESNIHPLNSKAEIMLVDSADFTAVNAVAMDSVDVSKITIQETGKRIKVLEPMPVKALPMQFKDDANASIQYLDIDQGLGYSYVNCMLEDKHGYLWFGLDGNGISRYDGVSFTNYTKKEGLTDNTVLSLMEDSKGNIWLGTVAGITRYDGNTFTQIPATEGLPQSRIVTISEGKQGEIWFKNSDGGITKYHQNKFTTYTDKAGLLRFDGKNLTRLQLPYAKETGQSYFIIEDSRQHIWIGTLAHGVYEYDGKKITHYSTRDGLSDNMISALMEDKKGNIWIGTRYDGVNKFDGKSFVHYSEKNGLSNNKVNSIMEDSYGNIWVATAGGGVNKINEAGFSQPLKAELFRNSRVRPMMKDKQGNLWFGTEQGGIYKYNGTGIFNYSIGKASGMHGLRSMLASQEGNLWFGKTDGGGLFKYNGQQFFHFPVTGTTETAHIFSILEDSKGNTWYSRSGTGVDKMNATTLVNYSKKEGMPSNKVFAIMEDSKGFIWMGTEGGGLMRYDGNVKPAGKAAFIFFTEREGLCSKSVTAIVEDKKGFLWLGTSGAGVCKFDGKTFTYFTEREGLSNNNVWSLKEDSTGKIWAGTDKGLSVLVAGNNINKHSKPGYTILSFGLEDGLKATDFNLNSVCIDNDNRIWWGNGKSVETVNLNQPFHASTPRSLNLNRIEINDRFYDFRNFPDSSKNNIRFSAVNAFNNYPEKLSLTYDQNHLSFFFSAIDWLAPHKIKYSYRLSGWADEWSKPADETKAEFRNLPYGNYTFEVKAIGQSQLWSKPFIYRFIIHPAWWQTWWFKSFTVITAILILLFIGRLIYISRLRKQRILLEKQLAVQFERQRISAEMHDDIGAGLSGIRLLTELTKNNIKDQQTAGEVEKIYQSVGDISAKMKEVIWSLNTENDHLQNLPSYLQQQVRLWLEHYPCQLSITLPDTVPDIQLNGEARRNIFLMIKEAVHNIIKHSSADKVTINMSCMESMFSISISDNGKGIDAAKNDGTGNGMRNMKQRIKILNGELIIKSQEGTTLIFQIPLQSTV